jgi:hypothetical protein
MEVHIKNLTTKRTLVKINILLFIIFSANSSKQKFLPHKNIFTHSFVSIDDYPMSKKKYSIKKTSLKCVFWGVF